ncbi:hypothetical protein CEXT_449811 [Caerostris extrusa]|uniref:Uncharacterized protein n=1 Tax=Caerostris extrusa TaxID=172846 RepID=A0AAV4ST30_CAEEX|nr:hypothetical protein CEXT_449811 [Caerostris extrusa]
MSHIETIHLMDYSRVENQFIIELAISTITGVVSDVTSLGLAAQPGDMEGRVRNSERGGYCGCQEETSATWEEDFLFSNVGSIKGEKGYSLRSCMGMEKQEGNSTKGGLPLYSS